MRTILYYRRKKKDVKGKIVLVTGGASGIGRLLALDFSNLGSKVVIWDVQQKLMNEVVDEIKSNGKQAFAYLCDVSKKEEVFDVANKVIRDVGHVDILINNAGVLAGKEFQDLEVEEIDRVLDVNLKAHFWTTKAFSKEMLKRSNGHIVTIASVAAFAGMYKLVEYCTSKFGSYGFGESIRREFLNTGIKTTLVCPWMIGTGMFQGAKELIIPSLKPEKAARDILESILYEQDYLVIPSLFYLIPIIRFIPCSIVDQIAVISGYHHAMGTYHGRGKNWLMGKSK